MINQFVSVTFMLRDRSAFSFRLLSTLAFLLRAFWRSPQIVIQQSDRTNRRSRCDSLESGIAPAIGQIICPEPKM
jgi:hypothetical protein